MKTRLTTAIIEQRLVHLLYDGKTRTVEPYLLGTSERGEDLFVGRQVLPWIPKEKSWQVFRLNNIYGLLVLETTFSRLPTPIDLPADLLSGLRLTA